MSSKRAQKAEALFKSGCTCSQAVVVAFCDCFHLDEETAMRLSCGFGGGFGRLREVCGAVSGMVMLAGLKYGNTRPDDAEAKKRTYQAVQTMADAFRARNGNIVCRELLGLGRLKDPPEPSARTSAYYCKRPCAAYVADAAEIVEQILFGEDAPPQS